MAAVCDAELKVQLYDILINLISVNLFANFVEWGGEGHTQVSGDTMTIILLFK
jgi:uncharacterized membrane protein YqhA